MATSNLKKVKRAVFINPQGYVQYPAPFGKTDTGGQILYVFQLAKALADHGVKVDILTRQFDNLPVEETVMPGVRIIRMAAGGDEFIPKEKMYEHVHELVDNFLAHVQKKKLHYDVIHSHYWDGGYAGLLLAKALKVPHVHTPHSLGKLKKLEMAVEELPPQKLKPAYRYHVRNTIEQRILSIADATVVICETSRIQLLEHYVVDFEKIHVIYPGVDSELFGIKKNKYDSQVKLAPNAILTMSRMVPAKGIDRVIDVLGSLRSKLDFHLYLGGASHEQVSGEEERVSQKEIAAKIKKYHLTNRVTFLGNIDHDSILPAYYRQADVFINASRYEPFGLTTLEAMACRTVPIISSVAGSKEVVLDGLNGYIIDMHDRKELAERLEKLLTDPKKRRRVADNALMTIQDHYSWDKIVGQFIKLYQNLV